VEAKAPPPAPAVATNVTLSPQASPRANGGFLPMKSLLKAAWKLLWANENPLKLYPEEARGIRLYYERTTRTHGWGAFQQPHPLEGETSEARSCFFLRKFTGTRELYAVDTEAQTIIPLAFLAFWQGEPQHYDLEIGIPKD
jgi:hypothetical protein